MSTTSTSRQLSEQRALRAMQRCRQLSEIRDDDLVPAARSAMHVVLARGEHVFWRGAPGADVYVVDTGRIAARYRAADGRVVDMGVAGAGDLLGYFEVFDGSPRSCDAVAVAPSTVWRIPAPVAERLLTQQPTALLAVIHDLLRIVRLQTHWIGENALYPVPARLAGLLLASIDGHGRVVLDGPQELLAQRLGVARQTLNRALHGLVGSGVVRLEPGGRTVTVLDLDALARIASEPALHPPR